jgi:DNA-binding winged helix-turn-helix (wHTH) protein/tetratricopeptide (TPR) repeat protein
MRYIFGECTLDTQRAELARAGCVYRLRRKVFQALAYLLAHADRVVSKQELCEQVWPQQFISDAALESVIKAVRQAIGDSGRSPRLLQTVYGQGYRWMAAVTTADQPPPDRPAIVALARASTDGSPEMDALARTGTRERGAPVSTGEWKLVTVLCCALAAPPSGAALELETHYRQLSALYALTREAVQRYGGTLQPLAGDQIVAIFGAPLAQEEHAQRAVLAALELQRRVHEAGSALSAPLGSGLAVRLGLHTGQVAVGLFEATPEGAGAVVGDTLMRASALQAQAAPGTIQCSQVTARLVSQVVQVAVVEPAPLAVAPLLDTVYTVLGRRAPGRLLSLQEARVLTPFIGRTRELAILHTLMAQVEDGRGQVVGIIGEPGIGKTRLCAEFVRRQWPPSWCLLDTYAVSYNQAIPYRPVIDLLKAYFHLDERDPAPAIHDQITTRLRRLDAALTPLAPALLALLDVPVEDPQWQALDPPQRRQQTFQALKQLVLRASQDKPLLVVIENLHWLDTETQACLDTLVEGLPTARLLLLVTYRPDYQHSWGHKTYYTRLRLDPLSRLQAHALLDARLGDAAGLRSLKQQVIALTQGNPFFLEESVQTLIETGSVHGICGADRLGAPRPMLHVPITVQAVLADRLDRLPPEEKHLVQVAAVIGMEAPLALLRALTELSEEALRRSLAHLQAVEFLYETPVFPASAYTFKHALTHEVAYGSLLQDQRRVLHARIVEAMEALAGEGGPLNCAPSADAVAGNGGPLNCAPSADAVAGNGGPLNCAPSADAVAGNGLRPAPTQSRQQIVEQVARLAHHAQQGEVWDKAVRYGRQAGEKALTRSAYREAVAAFAQALEALQHLPESRASLEQAIDIRMALGNALWLLGDYQRRFAYLCQAETLATALDDARRLALISITLVHHCWLTGDAEQAITYGQRALALAAALGDRGLQCAAHHPLSRTYFDMGDYRQAIASCRQVVTFFTEDRLPGQAHQWVTTAVLSRVWLGLCLAEQGAFAEGLGHTTAALRLAETAAHPYGRICASFGMGGVYLTQGDVDNAIDALERSLGLYQRWESPLVFPWIAAQLGYAYVLAGRVTAGLPLLEQAVQQVSALRSSSHPRWVAWLSEAYRGAGRWEDAIHMAGRADALSHRHKGRGHQAYALWLRGEMAAPHTSSEADQAATHYRQALALAETLGMRPLQAHCHRGLGTLYAKTGQAEQARPALSAAMALYRALDMDFWLPQTEAALAQGRACSNARAG